ncbi:MAG TPA: nucleotidyl transferase AbiEii/AbiGii toxin family protein [Acidimicrobiia bacterium]|jgi:hypothetical protein|nr:nucleotidyl transferase AbiEii/AbiGii toxin family protein [Acidimicrobiia bacterium]
MALENRLLARSNETGISLDRLRRRVVFERVVARLQAAEPGRWVIKGGMALEMRLGDEARLTKDLDLGLRDDVRSAAELHERLIEALMADPDGDGFVLGAGVPKELPLDSAGHLTWRVKVSAALAGKLFGGLRIDVSPRVHELDATDQVTLPNSLAFAGITTPTAEVIDVHRHAAEKFHAMLRAYGDRENSRVRDLVDLVILVEHDLLNPNALRIAVDQVWRERDATGSPTAIPPLPDSWPIRYEQLATDHDLQTLSFADAVALINRLWAATQRSSSG